MVVGLKGAEGDSWKEPTPSCTNVFSAPISLKQALNWLNDISKRGDWHLSKICLFIYLVIVRQVRLYNRCVWINRLYHLCWSIFWFIFTVPLSFFCLNIYYMSFKLMKMIIIGRIVCACVTIWQVNVQHFQHVQSTIRPIKQEGPVKIWNGSK